MEFLSRRRILTGTACAKEGIRSFSAVQRVLLDLYGTLSVHLVASHQPNLLGQIGLVGMLNKKRRDSINDDGGFGRLL